MTALGRKHEHPEPVTRRRRPRYGWLVLLGFAIPAAILAGGAVLSHVITMAARGL